MTGHYLTAGSAALVTHFYGRETKLLNSLLLLAALVQVKIIEPLPELITTSA